MEANITENGKTRKMTKKEIIEFRNFAFKKLGWEIPKE